MDLDTDSLSSWEKACGKRRTDILAGNRSYALDALKGNQPIMTALAALCAAVQYGWDDSEMLKEISGCENVASEVCGNPFGWYATAARHLLTGEEYRWNNKDIKRFISDKMTYYRIGEVVE